MTPTELKKVFDTETKFHIDTPRFLKEVIECSGQRVFAPAWNIFKELLCCVAQRATELHDPVLDALMVKMSMYELDYKQYDEIIKKLHEIYNEGLKGGE